MKRTRLFIGIAFVFTAILVSYALSSAQGLVGPISFTLEEENASGETGTVTLTDLGAGKTMVDVTVSGQPAESSQPIQIHEGQCGGTLARIVYSLNDLKGGKSSTTIDASLGALAADNAKYAINSHKSEQEYNIYVLCGNLPSLTQVAAQATATQQAVQALQTSPPGGIKPVTFALMPENNSGQSGTVTLTDLGGGKTMVQVNVTGEPAGAIQPLHIHDGQCGPTLARLAYNLEDLVDGQSETTIDASINSLTSEGFSFAINSHKSQKEYHIYVLCGNIPSASQTTGSGALPTAVIAIATTVPATATSATTVSAATQVPVATQVLPSATSVPATATTAAATATRIAPTATTIPSTATRIPPTATSVPPTATTVPATATNVPPTATSVPPTATTVPATATNVPPTATSIPATATSAPATATRLASTATVAAPTATQAAPTSASASAATVAPTTVAAQATSAAPTTQAAQATDAAPTTVAAQATSAAPTTQAAQETAVAPTSQATQETAVAPTSDAAQATDVAPTSDPAATATPAPTIPQSGGNPYSAPYLALTMLGILVVAAGLSLIQYSQRGSGGN